MPRQLVMDHNGHSTHEFDKADRKSLDTAERRFLELTGQGFTAAERTGPGESRVVRSFDPAVEEVLFYPRLQGG